jgi:Ca2+-binding RTX toxin-like protein
VAFAAGTVIENAWGGDGADQVTGTAGDNHLSGGRGDDTLDGGAGADQLDGGAGNDVEIGGAGADRIAGGGGIDTASYIPSTGGVNVNLTTGLGVAFEAQGDTLTGIERLVGGSGSDWLRGDADTNVLTGNAGNDTLQGFGGIDTLNGGDGNDALYGGAGKDTLTGGAGADRFVFSAASDSPVGGSSTSDAITDFSQAQGDRIDLATIDANSGAAGDQAFGFIGAAAFTHHAGELRAETVSGVTSVYGDINGDGVADFQIRLSGAIALVAADFVL